MNKTVKTSLSLGTVVIALMISGCADKRAPGPSTSTVSGRDTVSAPRTVGRYKVGKPYQIRGAWYHPREDFGYREVGMASWYGRRFHGRNTANGEIYDMNAMTAAHRTLPLPSMVRVTNLSNGRSVNLRVNDRGPFAKGRIIDVSRKAAQVLGFKNQGVTRVRVEIMADESRALARRGAVGGRVAGRVGRVGLTPDPKVAALNRQQLATAKARRPSRRATMARVSPPPPAAGPRTYIQAGSYADHTNAHRVRSRLSGLGPVEVRKFHLDGRGFYRVRVGPLPTGGRAERMLAEVIRAGYPASRIIRE